MSGLDVASGIAGLIALTIQVGGVVHEYARTVKEYSKTIKELGDELDLLTKVLNRLSTFIDDEIAKGRDFEKDSFIVDAITECTRRVERIREKLKPSGVGRVSRTLDRLKWPFEHKDVVQLVGNLRQYINTFELALNLKNSEFLSQSWEDASRKLEELQNKADQTYKATQDLGAPIDALLERSQQIQRIIEILPSIVQQSKDLGEVTQAVKSAEQWEQERRRRDILEWLTPLLTLSKHLDLQNKRANGTCKWLLEGEMFLDWSDADGSQYDILCQGGPGVGKSVLCSMVIDHLRTKFKDEEVAIAYYYFDLAEQQAQTEYTLARSILRQLCQHSSTIPVAVADFYQRTRNELQDALWLQELQTIVQRIAATFSQCFIIIDAFDEVDAKKRSAIAGVLEALRLSSGRVKFFATSRPHVVLDHFQNALTIDVRADPKDLRECLNKKILDHNQASNLVDDELRMWMLDCLCSHADGMFLLPSLQVDQILSQAASSGDIIRAIENLSADLRQVFHTTMVRIDGLQGSRRNAALKTLMWLSHARRPLRISELLHAIAVRSDNSAFSQRDVPPIELVVDSCFGFIEIDGETACIKFVHGYIAEYFRSQEHGFFRDAELEIVRVCLKYLTMDHLQALASGTRVEFIKAMEAFPLLEYASSFWGYHAYGLDVAQYRDLAIRLCESSKHLLVTARVRDIRGPEYRKWGERMTAWSQSGGAGIWVAASFGLVDLTALLISQKNTPVLDARNIYGSTPLHICSIFGFAEMAEVLIKHGADLNEFNNGKATAFYLAVSYGHLETCRVILQNDKTQVDVECKYGNRALHQAADIGNEIMVEFLLGWGPVVDAKNNYGTTAIHLAAQRGYTDIVQMLVLAGADFQSADRMLMTPLDFAARGGHSDIVQYLLKQGPKVNQKSKEGWSALHRAARAGHTRTVELLLAAGADVMDLDRRKTTPFQLAVRSGSLETVKTILNHQGALLAKQLLHRDVKQETALNIAFFTSQYHIYEYIRDLEIGTLENGKTLHVDPLLPLSRAIERGDLFGVKEIIERQPEWLLAKDNIGQTPLHTAFRAEQKAIAEYFLDLGASINSQGYHDWTPLHLAAASGNLSMLSLALQWNADLFLPTMTLQSPLHKAISSRSIPVILELLRCGCLPSSINDKAMTPVHVAARINFLDGVLLMIRYPHPTGGSYRDLLFGKDLYGRTPRAWAERAGHLELISVLKDEERFARGRPTKSNHRFQYRSSNTDNSGIGSMSQLSRQSTADTLSRRSTNLSQSTTLTTPMNRSVSSLDDFMGRRSPMKGSRSPNPQSEASKVGEPWLDDLELRYVESQLDLDSD